jgi:ABC-type uncharacterized transport system fused permease/ATPase subunit
LPPWLWQGRTCQTGSRDCRLAPHSKSSASQRGEGCCALDTFSWRLLDFGHQGYLFRAAFLRRVPLFMRNLGENVLLCLVASAIEATSKRFLAQMELAWRASLTRRIHKGYFENMVTQFFLRMEKNCRP